MRLATIHNGRRSVFMIRPLLQHGPGIYVLDVPSGAHPIVGVPTAVTAFVGRFESGPVGQAVSVSNYEAAVAIYGGILPDSPVTYALRDFFQNGGEEAVIVRLFAVAAAPTTPMAAATSTDDAPMFAAPASDPSASPTTPPAASPSSPSAAPSFLACAAQATVGGMAFVASSPGKWGANLSVAIAPSSPSVAQRFAPLGLQPADLFDITITYTPTLPGTVETLVGVTCKEGPRRVDLVLEQASKYLRLTSVPHQISPSTTQPSPTDPTTLVVVPTPLSGGTDSAPLVDTDYTNPHTGFAEILKSARRVNLLVVPPDSFATDLPATVLTAAAAYCMQNLAFFLVEPRSTWGSAGSVRVADLAIAGREGEFAAVYYPPACFPGQPSPYPLTGILAGIYAATDARGGVWKAPAGVDAVIPDTAGLTVELDDVDRNTLNIQGVNALRDVPNVGTAVWGARTLNGADELGSDYKYVPVRRLSNYIESSVASGVQWAVFEPNDDALWSKLRLGIGTFMGTLFRRGAFAGGNAEDAYFVLCDATTTTPDDQAAGIVNIEIGFAPVRPAEFIVVCIRQDTASSS